jgi:HEAT repeat protein
MQQEAREAQELLQTLARTRKNLRIYPENNPVCAKTVADAFKRLQEYLHSNGELHLKIRQNELLLGDAPVYRSTDRDDNLAMLFFKDGIRELTIREAITEEEFRDFMKILAQDLDREDVEDDIVTLMWERDFEHIRYVVDENFLLEEDDYQDRAVKQATEEGTQEEDLKKAYQDALQMEARPPQGGIVPITEQDLNALVKEIERDSQDKFPRLSGILVDLLFDALPQEYPDVMNIFQNALEYAIASGNFASAVHMLRVLHGFYQDEATPPEMRKSLRGLFAFASSPPLAKMAGTLLDEGKAGAELFSEYAGYLGKEAIGSFITVLGELRTIEARKTLIEALARLGQEDLEALAQGLRDQRWYVVRNIIYIFRRIGDRRAVGYLMKTVHHPDVRVRMEALRALGELRAQEAVALLGQALEDPEAAVRSTAARALGRIGSPEAKALVFAKVTAKEFLNLQFSEKKEFFEVLAGYNDEETYEFLLRTIKKRALLKRAKVQELKACAAYALGLMKRKEALAVLHKLRESKNRLLSEYAYAAIRRIEYGT